ncbi:MAG: nuclear transport factor 2 family protein [Woeseiaceae bacterium]
MFTGKICAIIVVVASILLSASLLAKDTEIDAHSESVTDQERAALDVVARRTAAYNKHDIGAFLATYDAKVRVYEFPDRFLGAGRARMRDIFAPQFAENDGRIVVHSQHALGNTVVSDETTTVYDHTEHNIGIYTVSDGLIIEVRLIEPSENR